MRVTQQVVRKRRNRNLKQKNSLRQTGEIDWSGTTAENSDEDKKKKIAQMVPPQFAEEMAIAVMNGTKEWESEQFSELRKNAGSGGGPRGALLPDVRMVQGEGGSWEVVRIMEGMRRKSPSSVEAEILVCASRDLKARWYQGANICRVDCWFYTTQEGEKRKGGESRDQHDVRETRDMSA